MEKELLTNIIQMQGQLKLLHWQTESFAEHNAFGETYETLNDLFDQMIEVYSGKYQRPKLGGMKDVSFADYDTINVNAFIDGMFDFISDSFMSDKDSELANIRDEIQAALMKLKYLLTLK
jgi:hypothetical protein